MSDPMVLAAQQWVNSTFADVDGYTPCTEDGITGQETLNSLIEGLQNVLGISPVVANFGPGTLAALEEWGTIGPGNLTTDLTTLVQCGLYCKGYDGSALSGSWDSRTVAGVNGLQADLGYSGTQTTGDVSPKLFKFLLNTDPAVLIAGGQAGVRSAQQWLNTTYVGRENFFYGSTGGVFDRPTQINLVYGIQYELGQTDADADGQFGPGTEAQLQADTAAVVTVGDTDGTHNWVHLFKAAINFNGYAITFTGTYTGGDQNVVLNFQLFEGFSVAEQTGIGDFTTWCEMLVSTGNPARPGTAADMASTITAARAAALVAAGYTTVGRYLTNEQVSDPLDKNIKPGELDTIFAASLRLFPIFEEGGYDLTWFTYDQGLADAQRAYDAAVGYGLPAGTVIYFAVDCDAQQTDIDDQIIPYFQGVNDGLAAVQSQYVIGAYGARNICSNIYTQGLARFSFVGGLSTGWSGNLGFPLPSNWAFNQIQTLTVDAGGTGAVQIDKNIASGRDLGIASTTSPPPLNAAFFSWLALLQNQAVAWSESGQGLGYSSNTLVLQYMRWPKYGRADAGEGTPYGWDVVAGVCDVDFINSVDASGLVRIDTYTDPSKWAIPMDPEHFAAAANAVYFHGPTSDSNVYLGDAGGWAGDFLSSLVDFATNNPNGLDAYAYGIDYIGAQGEQYSYSFEDYMQDVDGMLVAMLLLADSSLSVQDAIVNFYNPGGGYATRFSDIKAKRYGGSDATIYDLAYADFDQTSDLAFAAWRGAVLDLKFHFDIQSVSTSDLEAYATAYRDVLNRYVAGQ